MWLGNSVVVIGNLSCTLENMPEALYYTQLEKKANKLWAVEVDLKEKLLKYHIRTNYLKPKWYSFCYIIETVLLQAKKQPYCSNYLNFFWDPE